MASVQNSQIYLFTFRTTDDRVVLFYIVLNAKSRTRLSDLAAAAAAAAEYEKIVSSSHSKVLILESIPLIVMLADLRKGRDQ